MTLEPIYERMRDAYILWQMRSIQRTMDSVQRGISNDLQALAALSTDLINLRHQRRGGIKTERRGNRIKRVLFGLMRRAK